MALPITPLPKLLSLLLLFLLSPLSSSSSSSSPFYSDLTPDEFRAARLGLAPGLTFAAVPGMAPCSRTLRGGGAACARARPRRPAAAVVRRRFTDDVVDQVEATSQFGPTTEASSLPLSPFLLTFVGESRIRRTVASSSSAQPDPSSSSRLIVIVSSPEVRPSSLGRIEVLRLLLLQVFSKLTEQRFTSEFEVREIIGSRLPDDQFRKNLRRVWS
uniref:Uncharacterized protein n=1 Tax=Ananas comosus var. bracteatus TaxID=296719 RepID=A0A6V7QRD3_ANACO